MIIIPRRTKSRNNMVIRYQKAGKCTSWLRIADIKKLTKIEFLFPKGFPIGERKRVLKRWGDKVISENDYVSSYGAYR